MDPSMRPAAGIAGLGVLLVLVAGTFDAEQLWVPAAAFLVLAGGACAWVALAARGVRVTRQVAAGRVVEDEPLDVTISVDAGPVGLPGAMVADELLPQDVAVPFGRGGRRVRIKAR